jgi:hypothetical protein
MADYTATSATSHPQSSKPRSKMPNGATNPWSKSNSPSLRQNQGDSAQLIQQMNAETFVLDINGYAPSHPTHDRPIVT